LCIAGHGSNPKFTPSPRWETRLRLKILKFTIKKINEEKYELKDIRAALKNLGH
jgi:hypothetical protein